MSARILRVAGVDTREAKATPTVRAAARAAGLIAAPGWVAAFATPVYLKRWWDLPDAVQPWIVLGLAAAGVVAALIAWRREPFPAHARARVLPLGADAALILALVAVIAARPRDPVLVAVLLPFGSVLAGWAIGRAARLASEACVEDVRSAAAGLVVTGALVGLLGAGHLTLVLRGSGQERAGVWAIVYVAASLASFARAWMTTARDRGRALERVRTLAEGPVSADGVLLLDRITVRFGPNEILHETSMTARAGELVALVGGNGAGKSTLLRVAAGLLRADAGRSFIDGEDVSELLPEERAAAGLAFVSGARPVFPDLTVMQNLRVAAFRTHLTHRSFADATEAILGVVPALADRRRSKAGVLSGGEQRLLAVAQTLYRRPKVLLADKLSLGLDAGAREAVLDLLRTLADEGAAVVVVDHDLPALLPRADRAALLARGTIVDFVPAASILQSRSDLLPATFLAGAAR